MSLLIYRAVERTTAVLWDSSSRGLIFSTDAEDSTVDAVLPVHYRVGLDAVNFRTLKEMIHLIIAEHWHCKVRSMYLSLQTLEKATVSQSPACADCIPDLQCIKHVSSTAGLMGVLWLRVVTWRSMWAMWSNWHSEYMAWLWPESCPCCLACHTSREWLCWDWQNRLGSERDKSGFYSSNSC